MITGSEKTGLGITACWKKWHRVYNYVLKEIPKHVLDEIAISSTNIREAIIHSDIETANKLLGYDFFFEGVVVDGDKLGRKLGYPTANLKMIMTKRKLSQETGSMLFMWK